MDRESVATAAGHRKRPVISPEDTVRDVLTRYPQAEVVFDRHGLGGCGGPQGPLEPIAFFALVHHVDPEALIRELNEFIARLEERQEGGSDTAAAPLQERAASLYRPFVQTSLALSVAAGFSLGVWALLAAAQGVGMGSLTWATLVQVHGQVQVWGFVALFVMGVAYHAVPRFRGRGLDRTEQRLARLSFWLLLGGVALRGSQMALPRPWAYPLMLGGSVSMLVSAGAFAWVMRRLLLTGPRREGYERWLLAAVVWLVLAAAFQVGLMARLWQTGSVTVPPAFNEAYLTALFHGFILTMVLGVSARTLPIFLGLKQSRLPLLSAGFWPVVGGTALLAVGQGLAPTRPTWPALTVTGAVLVLLGVLCFVGGLRLFEPRGMAVPDLWRQGIPSSYRYFIRVAYGWLTVSVLLGAFVSLRSAVSRALPVMTEVSAARHALALGFVTLIIVGMATRILPVFGGTRLFSGRLQEVAFWLLFVGAALRVGVELGWGYGTSLDPALSASGVLGWMGILLFAVNTWLTMQGRTLGRPRDEVAGEGKEGRGIGPGTPLSEVVRRVSGAVETLVAYGLYMLRDPQHREAALRTLTLEQAARMARVDVGPLVEALQAKLEGRSSPSQRGITPDMVVMDVLERHPRTLQVFLAHGFTPLANPAMREKLASTVTVAQAAQMRGVDLATLVKDLNAAARGRNPVKEVDR